MRQASLSALLSRKTSSGCSLCGASHTSSQKQHRTSFTKDQSVGSRQSWGILLVAKTCKVKYSQYFFMILRSQTVFKVEPCTKMHLNHQFAIKRMILPDPIFTVERLYQCLAFIYQPEPTLFISLSQVAQERKLTNMASTSHLVI